MAAAAGSAIWHGLLLLAILAASVYSLVWLDRRLAVLGVEGAGEDQRGPWGLWQPFFDGLKLLAKEDVVPQQIDGGLYSGAPLLAFVCVFLALAVIPFGAGFAGQDLDIGVFYFLVILGPVVIALMNAGWGSNSADGVLGAFRAATHLISYEVTIGFAMTGPVIMAQSFSTVRIVAGQRQLWYAVDQPLGFLIYVVAALAMSYRPPLDLPLAPSELQGGVFTSYSGARYGLFRAALSALFFALASMGTVLFLGGANGPVLPGPVWFLLKTYGLMLALIWGGRQLPRLRIDQMLGLAWKIVLPLALLNIVLAGVVALFV